MRMLGDEINNQISAGRRTIQRSLEDVQVPMDRVPRAAIYATGFAVVLALGVGGWMIYRSHRRRTLVQRLQDAVPDSVREMPESLRARAKGAVKAL